MRKREGGVRKDSQIITVWGVRSDLINGGWSQVLCHKTEYPNRDIRGSIKHTHTHVKVKPGSVR